MLLRPAPFTLTLTLTPHRISADSTRRARSERKRGKKTTIMSQSQSSVFDTQQFLQCVREYGQVLHAASTAEVKLWRVEHVSNAFGWADWVELHASLVADDDNVQWLEHELASMQDAYSSTTANRSNAACLPCKADVRLTMAQLSEAKSLLLRLLLANPSASDAIARAALDRGLAWEPVGGVDAAEAALLPGVRLHAELALLNGMRRRAIEWFEGEGEQTLTRPSQSSADIKTARGTAAAQAAQAASAASAAAAAIAAAQAVDSHAADLLLPPSLAGLAQLLWARAEAVAPQSPLRQIIGMVHTALAHANHGEGHGEALSSIWRLGPRVVAAACTAEAAMERRDGQALAAQTRSTPLLDAYCEHLRECAHALQRTSADEIDARSDGAVTAAQEADVAQRWETWRERWAALLRQPGATAARARAALEKELSGRSHEEQMRLRYLAERAMLNTGC